MRTIERERLAWEGTPFPLGRHVNHDDMSRQYPFRAAPAAALTAVRHERHVPVFDQGNLGSCTGNAAVGCLGTGLFWDTMDAMDAPYYPLDQAAAVKCYSEASAIDPFRGQYPPDDTGSDGLSVAKVLKGAGAISGYLHAFTLADALAALMARPIITGTRWLSGMFSPSNEGLIRPAGTSAGGHEYLADEYDPVRGWVGFTNSWGERWGKGGRFYMEAEVWGRLLAQDGDVTVFVPAADVAPQPIQPDADRVLADAVSTWARRDAICGRKHRRAIVTWLDAKGL